MDLATRWLRMTPEARQRLRERLAELATPARRARLEEVLAMRTRRLTVVLEDVYQPHNAAAVLRSCDCFGVQDVHVLEDRNPFAPSPEVAMGAAHWLNLHRHPAGPAGTAEALAGLRARGFRLVATALGGDAVGLEEVPLDRPVALLFGTEERGLTDGALAAADLRVRLPMYGFTQSFNVSVCAALCLYELTRRLRREREDWRLAPDEWEWLHLAWLMRSIPNGEKVAEVWAREPLG